MSQQDVVQRSSCKVAAKCAYTPCHYDTYGFNLTAQLFGHKRWILFPPSDSDCLHPTRFPYEGCVTGSVFSLESSVFSNVDILSAPVCLKASNPHVVVLSPGDLLYVPKKWWHFVQCLETSINVNTWVSLPSDADDRVSEAIVRAVIHLIADNKPDEKDTQSVSWMNPTEPRVDLEELLAVLEHVLRLPTTQTTVSDLPNHEELFVDKFLLNAIYAKKLSFDQLKEEVKRSPISFSNDTFVEIRQTRQLLLDCLTDPKTVSILEQLLKAKLRV